MQAEGLRPDLLGSCWDIKGTTHGNPPGNKQQLMGMRQGLKVNCSIPSDAAKTSGRFHWNAAFGHPMISILPCLVRDNDGHSLFKRVCSPNVEEGLYTLSLSRKKVGNPQPLRNVRALKHILELALMLCRRFAEMSNTQDPGA